MNIIYKHVNPESMEALGLYRKFGYTEIECYGRQACRRSDKRLL